jgi:hypothetical protein
LLECRIGGVSATKVVSLAFNQQLGEIWAAAVPTDTTASVDIVVTSVRCNLALIRMVNGNATSTGNSENSSAAGSTSAAITVLSGRWVGLRNQQ